MKYLALILIIGLTASGCSKKCETCYLIEADNNGNKLTEIDNGEYCGDDIKDQESVEFVSIDGRIYTECR